MALIDSESLALAAESIPVSMMVPGVMLDNRDRDILMTYKKNMIHLIRDPDWRPVPAAEPTGTGAGNSAYAFMAQFLGGKK